MTYAHFTKKLKTISPWWPLLAGLLFLCLLYGFNRWMLQREDADLQQSLAYTTEAYEEKLTEMAYDDATNQGKNMFVVNRDYYLARLEGDDSYTSGDNFQDYYANEVRQLENYDAGAYFLGMGAGSYVGKGVYQGDYLAGKKVLNHALAERSLPPQSLRYGTSNWMFPLAVLNHLSSYYGLLILLLLIGLPYLVKYENSQMRFLLTQPISRTKIILTDSVSVFVRIVAVVGGGLLLSYVIGNIFGSKIPADYPVLINDGTFHTMPLYRYLFGTGILLVLSVFFLYLICQLLVLLTGNRLISLVVTLLLVGYGQGIFNSQHPLVQKVAPYVPALYLTPQKVYTGLDYQVQEKIQMAETSFVPSDILKGEEDDFSLEARTDLSQGSQSASRQRFFVADFCVENSRYYGGKSFQRTIGNQLNARTGTVVLLVSSLFASGAILFLIQRKNFR